MDGSDINEVGQNGDVYEEHVEKQLKKYYKRRKTSRTQVDDG